jgi:hypothetical protein
MIKKLFDDTLLQHQVRIYMTDIDLPVRNAAVGL